MAGNLQQRLDSLKSKAEILTSRYRRLADEKRAADSMIADLRLTIERQRKEMSQLRQEVEYLSVVTTITPKRENVEQARVILSELIREIDKCITDLTD
ncbi:MAG: hypothetical protein NC043_06490 [Muribaculaceae bacterium]|nr:hypothetical protein [Muribaculaceae bacterium]